MNLSIPKKIGSNGQVRSMLGLRILVLCLTSTLTLARAFQLFGSINAKSILDLLKAQFPTDALSNKALAVIDIHMVDNGIHQLNFYTVDASLSLHYHWGLLLLFSGKRRCRC